MTASVLMLLKQRASLTCFRACFLPGRAKDLSAPRYQRLALYIHLFLPFYVRFGLCQLAQRASINCEVVINTSICMMGMAVGRGRRGMQVCAVQGVRTGWREVQEWQIRAILSSVQHRKWSNVTRTDEMQQEEGSR